MGEIASELVNAHENEHSQALEVATIFLVHFDTI
jgi:hypothetical protein